jgi:hypothetical protein
VLEGRRIRFGTEMFGAAWLRAGSSRMVVVAWGRESAAQLRALSVVSAARSPKSVDPPSQVSASPSLPPSLGDWSRRDGHARWLPWPAVGE